MSHTSIGTYIYRIERIDPQAKPFPNESDSIVQSNALSKLSRVRELAGTAWGKNPFEKRIIITSIRHKYFPRIQSKLSKLFDKFNYKKYPHKNFPRITSLSYKLSSKFTFHDVPRKGAHLESVLNFHPSRLRLSTQLHVSKNLHVSPISFPKSFPVVTKVFI